MTTSTAKRVAAKPAAKTAAKPATRTAAKPAAKPATRAAAKPAAKVAAKPEKPKKYVLLSGIDDSEFCQRVSDRMDEGYELYGSPAITFNGKNNIVCQALVLKKHKKGKK